MTPIVESSVIAFPRLEHRSVSSKFTLEEVERAVKLTAEDLRGNWLKSHASSPRVCARTRLINAAMVSDLSDNAFRVLCLQLSYTNGTHLRTVVGNGTIAALARCSERTVKRSNKELEEKKWVSVSLKRRDVAVRTMAIPEEILAQIGTEIMENFPPRLVAGNANQEVTEMSPQEDFPEHDAFQEGTKLSLQGPQEGTKLSLQGPQEVTNLSPQEGLDDLFTRMEPGQEVPNLVLRSAKNGPLICSKESVEEKKRFLGGAELDCIQSGREENCIQSEGESTDEAQPPQQTPLRGKVPSTTVKVASALTACLAGSLPVAAAPIDPPAIIQPAPAVPDLPECWLTPRAVQNAAMRAAEAKAQRQVAITPDGRLEATGGFLSELQTVFPLVDVTNGLMAAAPNIKPYMTAIETMGVIRRQFAYMQTDAKQKADREAKFESIRKKKSEPDRGQVGPDLFRW